MTQPEALSPAFQAKIQLNNLRSQYEIEGIGDEAMTLLESILTRFYSADQEEVNGLSAEDATLVMQILDLYPDAYFAFMDFVST